MLKFFSIQSYLVPELKFSYNFVENLLKIKMLVVVSMSHWANIGYNTVRTFAVLKVCYEIGFFIHRGFRGR